MFVGGSGGLIDLTRRLVLDDTVGPPFLWADDELIVYLNIIYEEFCKETLVIEDRDTVNLTRYPLLSNQLIYLTDPRVLNLKEGAYLLHHHEGGEMMDRTLKRTSEAYMDQTWRDWREEHRVTEEWHRPKRYIPMCGRGYFYVWPKYNRHGEEIGNANISFTAATSTISIVGIDPETGVAANFHDHFYLHLNPGDQLSIANTTLNNGIVTIATVSQTALTVSQPLKDEGLVTPTSAILRKVRNTLVTVINRLPLAPFTTADLVANPPTGFEIKEDYQRELMYGIGREAFQKEDTQTLDLAAADRNGKRFEAAKAKTKKELSFMDRSERQVRSGSGGIWKSY